MLFLISCANADVIYHITGHHILEDPTNYTSLIVGFYQEERLTFATSEYEEATGNMSSGSNILNFKLKYQDEDMSLKEIDNVTITCQHYTMKELGGFYGIQEITNETFTLLFDENSKQSEEFKKIDFQVMDGDAIYCWIHTWWNVEEWQKKGRQPPDLNGLSMAWEFPTAQTNFCDLTKTEMTIDAYDFYRDSYEEIQSYIHAFLLMNYKFWVIFYWIFKIFIYIISGGLIFLMIRFIIDNIKRLLQKRQRPTLTIKRGK